MMVPLITLDALVQVPLALAAQVQVPEASRHWRRVPASATKVNAAASICCACTQLFGPVDPLGMHACGRVCGTA